MRQSFNEVEKQVEKSLQDFHVAHDSHVTTEIQKFIEVQKTSLDKFSDGLKAFAHANSEQAKKKLV